MEWRDAGPLEALPDGRPTGIRLGTKAVVLVRRGDTAHAVDALCPHKFGPLEDGSIVDGHLACPLHDARFDLATGHAAPGGVTQSPLAVHATRVEQGRVEVLL